MRILLIHRYFWPDTPPYAGILLAIARRLSADGHQVEVLTSYPSYKSVDSRKVAPATEVIDSITIRRVRLLPESQHAKLFKLINLFYFPARVLAHQLINWRSIDTTMCSTVPAVMMGGFTALGAKITRSRFIYHCMDLHPEVGKISGEFRNNTLFKLLEKIDTFSCKSADKVIVLSNDMKVSLLNRNNQIRSIEVLNNFPLPAQKKDVNQPEADTLLFKENEIFRLLFAGNIGRFQNLEAFIDAMNLLRNEPDIELVFVGEGVMLGRLKSMVSDRKLTNVKFIPHQSVVVARQLMENANLGVVSLEKNVYKYAFPSKTMTYLEEGCKLLLCVESESELCETILKNDLGYCAQPGDPKSISKAIMVAKNNFNNTENKAKEFVLKNFSQEVILERWSSLFSSRN